METIKSTRISVADGISKILQLLTLWHCRSQFLCQFFYLYLFMTPMSPMAHYAKLLASVYVERNYNWLRVNQCERISQFMEWTQLKLSQASMSSKSNGNFWIMFLKLFKLDLSRVQNQWILENVLQKLFWLNFESSTRINSSNYVLKLSITLNAQLIGGVSSVYQYA